MKERGGSSPKVPEWKNRIRADELWLARAGAAAGKRYAIRRYFTHLENLSSKPKSDEVSPDQAQPTKEKK